MKRLDPDRLRVALLAVARGETYRAAAATVGIEDGNLCQIAHRMGIHPMRRCDACAEFYRLNRYRRRGRNLCPSCRQHAADLRRVTWHYRRLPPPMRQWILTQLQGATN